MARILVVDDEQDLCTVISRGVELAGYKVKSYTDPREALSNFRAGMYDLVLLDVRMPEINGFDLYEKIHAIDSDVKVCFLTAFDVDYFEMFRQRFPDVPVNCFIRKPILIKDLVGMVRGELASISNATSAAPA
jgi:CheY-like chemotaxis protein